jgi:hypothetical protein
MENISLIRQVGTHGDLPHVESIQRKNPGTGQIRGGGILKTLHF